jgi:hypothetical protein
MLLPMTDAEILREFNAAKVRTRQVYILADLNNTDVETIKRILIAQGVDHRALPRSKRKKEGEHHIMNKKIESNVLADAEISVAPDAEPKSVEPMPVPVSLTDALEVVCGNLAERVAAAEAKRTEIEAQIAKLTAEREQAIAGLSKLNAAIAVLKEVTESDAVKKTEARKEARREETNA